MGGEWRQSTWGDEVSLEYGKALRSHASSTGPYRVYGSNGPIGWTHQPLVEGPGVILGRKGAYRGVEFSAKSFFVIDTAYFVVPKYEMDIKWLYYAIKYHKLGEIDDGSPIPSTTRAAVYMRELEVPPLAEQCAIARILGTLDDKIELNRRMNETLEAMARALFKSWFVDFDPVHEKAKGRAPSGMDAETAKLFPSEFVESELGLIPRGWCIAPLNELSSHLTRGIGPAYLEVGGVCVLNQKCIRDHRVDFSKTRRHDPARKSIDNKLVRDLDILINSTGVGTLGRVAQVWFLPEDTIVDSHVTIVRAASSVDPLFLGSSLIERESEIEALGEGSTGQTELGRVRLGTLRCLVPPQALTRRFGEAVSVNMQRIAANEVEGNHLARLRDELLPRLLSGELSVADAEKEVELA